MVILANSNTSAAIECVTDAALDVLLGEEPRAPKPPITVPVGATLAAAGPEAASEQYHLLQNTQPDHYDADPWRFMDAAWGAIEVQRAEVVMPLAKLWVTLQPDATLAYEVLGWIYLVQGEKELAADNLRRALALDPDAWHAKLLLQQLNR